MAEGSETDAPRRSPAEERGGHTGVFSRLYRGETAIDFVGRRRTWAAISAVVIVVGLLALGIRGLNLGIDFVGGTSWQVPSSTLSVASTRDALTPLGLGGATIESLGTGSNRTVEVQDRLSNLAPAKASALKGEVTDRLASLAHVPASVVSLSFVGPTWGGQITTKALEALAAFFIAIAAYIALRFEWKMAAAAIAAVVHDLVVTVGIYAASGLQVTPATVVAVLTILGYSLYDTIVVFDRVMENVRSMESKHRLTYSDTVNLSMNQVLMRSLNTSIVAILPILSVLVVGAQLLGATTLQYFGLALLIGLTTGAYSSLFIASPLLAVLKEKEPKYRLIRQRLEQKGEVRAVLTPAAAAAGLVGAPRGTGADSGSHPGPIAPGSGAKARAGGGQPGASRPPATSRRAGPARKGRKR